MLMTSYVDIGIKRPDTLTIAIVEKTMMVIGEVYIVPRPDTFTPITQVNMVDCCIYLLLLVMFMKGFITKKDMILGVTTEYLELGPKRQATFILKTM